MSLYRKLLSAPAGSEELLLPPSPEITWAMDWSNDGRFLLYNVIDPKHGADIWALPLAGERKPFEVVRTDSNELLPQFSPDGKWMAYQSDKTGRFEIYVQSIPTTSATAGSMRLPSKKYCRPKRGMHIRLA